MRDHAFGRGFSGMSGLPLVIANPQAGNGSGRDRWWANSGLVADRLGPHDLVWTEEAGHAERIARAEGNERSLLIAYGGDGTASEVARGLVLSGGSAELGLLPSGTGNDFASDAGIPARLPEAAHFVSRTPARPTDLGYIEDAAVPRRPQRSPRETPNAPEPHLPQLAPIWWWDSPRPTRRPR